MDTKAMAEQAQEQAGNLIDKATGFANKATDLSKRATGAARDAHAAADLYLHEYAWTTMVVVAAVSGAVGYMLGRRSS